MQAVREYRPYIVGIALVLFLTYPLASVLAPGNSPMIYQLMNSFMGLFFIIFALPKFLNLRGFADLFQRYDLIAQHSAAYARAYPFIELSLGALLLSGVADVSMPAMALIAVVVVAVTGSAIGGIVRSLRKKEDLHCACMGSVLSVPLSKVTLIENATMFLMAFGMVLAQNSSHMMAVLL